MVALPALSLGAATFTFKNSAIHWIICVLMFSLLILENQHLACSFPPLRNTLLLLLFRMKMQLLRCVFETITEFRSFISFVLFCCCVLWL